MSRQKGPTRLESLLFFLLLSGPPRLRNRDAFASFENSIDWSILLSLIVWLLGSIWVTSQIIDGMGIQRKLPALHWIQLVSLVMVVTLTFSIPISPAPLLSSYRIAQIFVMLLWGWFWVNRFGTDSMLRHLLYSYMALGIIIIGAALLHPELVYPNQSNRLRGDNIANAGAVASIGIILLIGNQNVVRKRFIALFFLIFVYLLYAARTRSAYGITIVFLLLLVLRRPRSGISDQLRKWVIFLTPVIIYFSDPLLQWLIREERSISTLSSRTPVWNYLLGLVQDTSPITGMGFYTERLYTITYGLQLSAHNAFFEIYYGGGLLSAFFFILMLLGLFYSAIRLFLAKGSQPHPFTAMNLLVAVIAIGFVSEEMVLSTPTGFTFYMLVSLIPLISEHEKNPVHDPSNIRKVKPDLLNAFANQFDRTEHTNVL